MTEMSLVEWLVEQVDLDEQHAQKDLWCAERATNGGRWRVGYGYNLPYSEIGTDEAPGSIGRVTSTTGQPLADGQDDQHQADAGLIGRMASAARPRALRMLREVESKRKVIDWCKRMDPPYGLGGVIAGEARRILRWLAAVYADRPGYREEWAPAER